MARTQGEVGTTTPAAAPGDQPAVGRSRATRHHRRRRRLKRDGYDAFISYSHRADGEAVLARQIEHGLEQIGRRWTERRALSVFLDQQDLGANSGLDARLHNDLDRSAWLVYLASPASAAPDSYCAQELERWFATRDDAADRMLIVLTSGTLSFVDGDRGAGADAAGPDADVVDWARSTSAPAAFRGRLTSEPTYVDLSWARDQQARLSIRHDARFREAVTWIAAPIHGYDSPQELDSDDLRRYRRGRRLRRAGVAALAVLALVATVAAVVARNRQLQANRQQQRSESRALASAALSNAAAEPDLALLQALESVHRADTAQAWGSLLGVLAQPNRFQQRSTGGHEAPVTAVATSADGRLAASGDASGSVVLWHIDPEATANPASEPRSVVGSLPSAVMDLEIREENGSDVVVAVSIDGSVGSWTGGTGARVDSGPTVASLGVSTISEDGSLIASAVDTDGDGSDDQIIVRDAFTGETVDQTARNAPDEPVDRLLFRPGHETLIWSQGYAVVRWDFGRSEEPEQIGNDLFSVTSAIAVSPDGALLAVGESEGDIWIIDLTQGTAASPVGLEPPPTSPAKALAFRSDGGTLDEGTELASAHGNGDVRLWTVLEDFAFEQDRLRGHRDEATTVAFRPGGRLVSGGYDGELLWWSDLPTGGLAEALPVEGDVHASDVVDVAFLDEHGTTVASLDFAGALIVTDEDGTGELLQHVRGAAVDAANDVLVHTNDDGSIGVVSGPASGSGSQRTLSGEHEWAPEVLDLSADGTGLVSIADAAVVWDVGGGSVRSRLALPDDLSVTSALYGLNDRIWLGGHDHEGAVALEFDAASGALVGDAVRHGGSIGDHVSALALGPDGVTLATGGSDRAIRLWDAATHRPEEHDELSGHREIVTGMAFTADGKGLISVDRDNIVNLWDVAERQLVTVFGGPTDGINALALSADGRTLVVASEDDSVYRWTLDRGQWIERACELAARNLTRDEWRLYGRGPQQRLCDHPGEGPLVDWSERVNG